MERYALTLLVGIATGTLARLFMLRSDYRQYPGYPHGFVTHISLGFIAAFLGAIAIPAVAAGEYTAATFLALAAQQFGNIRDMERKSLAALEKRELVPRGLDYIEGIARAFESRNYLAMASSLAASLATYYQGLYGGVAAGVVMVILNHFLKRGQVVAQIAEVQPAPLEFRGPILQVAGIAMMNIGLTADREKILAEGLGALLKPRDDNARATLHDVGQRQAILHTAAALVGVKVDEGEEKYPPRARKDVDSGAIAVFILPNEPDMQCFMEAIKQTPVLESSRRHPLATSVGRKAAD